MNLPVLEDCVLHSGAMKSIGCAVILTPRAWPVPSSRCVRRAHAHRFDGDGIAPCWDNSLHVQYKYHLEMPNGEMENNLVRECDNHDVPDYDYRTCEHNTYMCCWTENNDQGMQDNTVSYFLWLVILHLFSLPTPISASSAGIGSRLF